MAQRFYFDVVSGGNVIRDPDGVLAADLDEATHQAQAVLREMRAAGELTGVLGPWELVIRGEDGILVRRIAIT
ncbi:DUF6894 family protein [Methylobacterium sp. A54F]